MKNPSANPVEHTLRGSRERRKYHAASVATGELSPYAAWYDRGMHSASAAMNARTYFIHKIHRSCGLKIFLIPASPAAIR